MWGEVSENNREKGHLGSREEGENRGRQTPTRRWTETLLERLGEAERERNSGDRAATKRRREGTKEGRSLERNVPKETETSW